MLEQIGVPIMIKATAGGGGRPGVHPIFSGESRGVFTPLGPLRAAGASPNEHSGQGSSCREGKMEINTSILGCHLAGYPLLNFFDVQLNI